MASPSDLPEELDHTLNGILLFCMYPTDQGRKISQLAAKSDETPKELVDRLCRIKQELVEQALFTRYLSTCLDKDPFASHSPSFDLYFDLEGLSPDELTAITVIGGITEESLQSLLDGIALFLQTPADQITCMPRGAAILLKMAAHCWVFLGLNLAEAEMPTHGRMSRLLIPASGGRQPVAYSALERILRRLRPGGADL